MENSRTIRRLAFIIENDEIEDGVWYPLIVETLRELADHLERTRAGGFFPQCFKSANGNKIVGLDGTCIEETLLR